MGNPGLLNGDIAGLADDGFIGIVAMLDDLPGKNISVAGTRFVSVLRNHPARGDGENTRAHLTAGHRRELRRQINLTDTFHRFDAMSLGWAA